MSGDAPTRLARRQKLGYGVAETGVVAAEVLIELYLLKFYNVAFGLPSLYTALALGIALVWDAVSDPLMGEISDRTTSAAGRRRPYFVPGAVALAAALALLFNPPAIDGVWGKFVFLLGGYLTVTTAMTVLSVPHLALAGELSFDRDERTEIFGYRRLFTTCGLLVGTLLPALVLRSLASEEGRDAETLSRNLSSIYVGALIVVAAWWTYRATRGLDHSERPLPGAAPRAALRLGTLLKAQLGVARHPVFRPLLAAFIIAGLGRALNASLALYYYEYKLRLRESDTVLFVLVPFFISILASIPFWVAISRRLGKKLPAFCGVFGLGALVSAAYPFLPPGALSGPIAVALVGGFLAGSLIIFESLVADVVDVDELETRHNREGLYFGMWKMGTKISRALGLVLAGALLDRIGFDASAEIQTEAVSEYIGWVFGPGVGVLLIVGASMLVFFPLSDAQHRRVQRTLKSRRGAAPEADAGKL